MHTSEARRRRQFNLAELYQINWFLGILMAMLSIGSVVYLGDGLQLYFLFGLVILGLACLRPQLTTLFPRLVWHLIPFLLVILLALDLHLTPEPVPALIRLNLLLIVYRALAFRRKREDLQLVILCLFLLIIVGVTTVSFTFPVQVLFFTAVAMSFLFNVTLMEGARDEIRPEEVWRHFTLRGFVRVIRTGYDTGFLAVAGIALVSVVGVSVLLFLLIPRFDLNNPIPFFGMNRTSQTGFSEQIRFGDVTDIRNDDKVALRVEVDPQDEIPANPYWRMLVLDEYVNGGFRVSYGLQYNARMIQQVREVRHEDWLIQGEEPERRNRWTLYLEGGIARYLPLTGRFGRIRFQETRNFFYLPQIDVLGMPQVNSNLLVYQVEDMEFGGVLKDSEFGNYTLDYSWYPEIGFGMDQYVEPYPETTLALPLRPEEVGYLERLVEEIGGGEALTAVEFARRATGYLQKGHSYSMTYSIGYGTGDHVIRWLKSDEPGHCEMFAGSLLLICRAAGIPARVVTGFQGGAWNAYENYFMVRNSDAHAWVEIFDGLESWVRIDPTPGMMASGEDGEAEGIFSSRFTDSSFAAYVDSLRILWYRRIVNFDQSDQTRLWNRIQEAYSEIRIRERLAELKEKVLAWWRLPWGERRLAEVGASAAVLVLSGLLLFLVFRRRGGRSGGPADPVRRKSGELLRRLQTLPVAGEPEEELERRLEGLISRLQILRFGRAESRGDWKMVLREARRFVREWR